MALNGEKFNSINDLYERVIPALKTKLSEFKRENILSVKEKDIWNYCLKNKWNNSKDLRLYEVVDDILNIGVDEVKYIKARKVR